MNYASKEYWEKRYASNSQTYEFICGYPSVRKVLLSQLRDLSDRILVLGTGTSLLAEQLALEGCSSVAAIDWSASAIAAMRKRKQPPYPPDYQVMDALRLTFPTRSFTLVVDKGCLDATLCRSPSDVGFALASRLLQQARSVIAGGGAAVFISVAPPEDRVEVLQAGRFADISCVPIPREDVRCMPQGGDAPTEMTHLFAYVCAVGGVVSAD